MPPVADALDAALAALKSDVRTCQSLENTLRGRGDTAERSQNGKPVRKRAAADLTVDAGVRPTEDILSAVISKCKQTRAQAVEDAGPPDDTGDLALAQHTRHTDGLSLEVYARFLHYVPRLVNVVSTCYCARTRLMITTLRSVFDFSLSQP